MINTHDMLKSRALEHQVAGNWAVAQSIWEAVATEARTEEERIGAKESIKFCKKMKAKRNK